MSSGAVAWTLAALSAGAFVVVSARRVSAPLAVSLGIGLTARVVFAAVTSRGYTPRDVGTYFHSTGTLILQGKDPLLHLPGRQWNFLQLMPYIHALEIKTGLAWVYAVKIVPIACDVLLIWLVSLLASDAGRARALQYAVNPLSLFVVSLHGQVEPVALALALGGLVLLRGDRWFRGGVLLGAAIAAKTWPLIIAVAAISLTRARKLPAYVLGCVTVPLVLLASGVLFLDTRVFVELKHIASYSSFVGTWGWAGVLVDAHVPHVLGYSSRVGHLGSALCAVAVIGTLVVFRRRRPEVRALVALCAFLVVTAGFGVQYLLWPLPLMIALGRRVYIAYVVVAAGYAADSYLNLQGATSRTVYSAVVIAVLIAVIVEAWYTTWGDVGPSGAPMSLASQLRSGAD